jgi:hypothetical protein
LGLKCPQFRGEAFVEGHVAYACHHSYIEDINRRVPGKGQLGKKKKNPQEPI